MVKIYIAGPMTGLPDLNYPAFHEAAAALRAAGHEVFNPAENPEPTCGSWNGYMRMAIAQLTQCEAIYLLHGWSASKGARLEYRIAQDFQIKPIFQHNHRELGERDWRESFQELMGMCDRARLRAATSLQFLPPKAITASVMREDGGERPAYCLMAAYRTEADAVEALGALAATQAEVQAEPVAWPHKEIGMVAIEWGRQKRLFPVLSKDGWMDKAIAELSAAYKAAAPQAKPAAVAVPDGYKLVPMESTERMEQAAADYLGECVKASGLWKAMLDVSPALASTKAEVQAEPVLYVSPEQLNAHTDPKPPYGGRYLPSRKTPKGKFTQPLFTAPQAQPADALDAAFEAVRKRLCKLPRHSFHIDSRGNIRRVTESSGNWIEFASAHALFDPVAVDAAMAAAQEGGNAASGKDGV